MKLFRVTHSIKTEKGLTISVELWEGPEWWAPTIGIIFQSHFTKVVIKKRNKKLWQYTWDHCPERDFFKIKKRLSKKGLSDNDILRLISD